MTFDVFPIKTSIAGDLTTRKRKLEKEKWEIEQPDTKYTAIALDNELNSKALDLVETFLKLDKETPEEEVIKAIKEHREFSVISYHI